MKTIKIKLFDNGDASVGISGINEIVSIQLENSTAFDIKDPDFLTDLRDALGGLSEATATLPAGTPCERCGKVGADDAEIDLIFQAGNCNDCHDQIVDENCPD